MPTFNLWREGVLQGIEEERELGELNIYLPVIKMNKLTPSHLGRLRRKKIGQQILSTGSKYFRISMKLVEQSRNINFDKGRF